jgi:hypothetical protein
MPHDFWLPLFTNLTLFTLGLLLTRLLKPTPPKNLTNLTIWT